MKSAFALGTALLAAVAGASCGQAPIPPTAPSQSSFITPIGGMWSGTLTLTEVGGGECVGAEIAAASALNPSTNQGTITVLQDGADISATFRAETTGATCTYAGSASLNRFSLNDLSCTVEVFYQCANGQPRVLQPIGSTLTGVQNGNEISGTVATSYNVFSIDPDNRRRPLSGLTMRHSFTANRR